MITSSDEVYILSNSQGNKDFLNAQAKVHGSSDNHS